MKFKNVLNEKWYDTYASSTLKVGSKDKSYEVYINPNSKDMKDLTTWIGSKYFGFIADPIKKQLFVFKLGVFHEDVARNIYKKSGNGNVIKHWMFDNYITWGVGIFKRGKLPFIESLSSSEVEYQLSIDKKYARKKLKYMAKLDWSWINKYINCSILYNFLDLNS